MARRAAGAKGGSGAARPEDFAARPLRLDDQLCFALYAATNAVVRAYRPMLRELGLTYPQYLVMLALWQDGPSPIGTIADRLSLPQNALSPLLERLSKNGLVRRQRDPADRRVIHISLTEAGAALEPAASRVQQAVECHTGLDPDALAAMRGALRALALRTASAGGPGDDLPDETET
ncbi:MarR family winged helix-turn-helix transcriptional regulator [Rubrimonas cliftonensis]|uniref:MarR family winged helix-turn-helix transcriptional regulator n=1 Tax=Rubrimonas cliftonensis TaxID=89524 RepID=UPI001C31C353|nr:MarR family transcriptional regulator [Rubrimonas cliftonensis]